ncbi:helix-turn-helix transcriptional regulator [Actinocrispum wychmicini]|uniref:DNA-binding NarL/FixJ family response regulator n=1 Tax=Actinocrispum wychmicini TaxID=1213861 RepID=A0A4R2JA98_9PSEU|nr:LuxR C-terminal-related transcriptional regulator [Actinocrispum wychmicini]TCO52869.1 DNA-binding NarL/FixJ family response regulator [Actinocrispum wychmicini]
MERIRIVIQATDPITYVGLGSYLRSRPEVTVVDQADQADVQLFSTERVGPEALTRLRALADDGARPTVLITGELAEAPLLTLVECHVVAILPKSSATGDQVVDCVVAAAAGNGVMPRDVLGTLLRRIQVLQQEVLVPNGLSASGLEPREVDVLRLIAEGWGTEEIAKELAYSERTVKNVIFNLTTRLHLRNRAHAVAYALRAGVI